MRPSTSTYITKTDWLLSVIVVLLLLCSGTAFARVDLLSDDFERSSLNGGTHTYTVTPVGSRGKSSISTQTANSGSRSMYICCDAVYVTSEVIDLSGVNYAEIALWLRQGDDAFSETPSLGDDLSIEVLLSNNTWQQIALWEGSTATGGTIYNANIKIPEAAYHSGFRFRFFQWDGSGSSLTDRDFWHIDDLKVTDFEVGTVRYPLFYDGFERNFLMTPPSGSLLPDWTFNRVDGNFTSEISNHTAVAGTRSMYTCCGERYTTTRDIDLTGQTFVELEYWIRYGDDNFSGTDALTLGNYNSEDPSAAELYVQIYRADGVWQTIAFHDPSASNSGESYWYRARVPDNAIHDQFKLRFYQADGSISSLKRYDFYHIDEVYVGTRDDLSSSIDHFRLSYASNALTCAPQAVTLQACANSDCSTLYTDPTDVTLTPAGWDNVNPITVNGGTANLSYSRTTTGTVSLGVGISTPVASNPTLCSIDGGAYGSNCSLTFADAGLVVDVPDFLSHKGTLTATVTAVRKSNNAQECVPAFSNVSKNVRFWSQYTVPGSGSRNLTLGSPPTAVSTNSASPTTVALNFNDSGQATLPLVNYTDAGQKTLYAQYQGSGSDAGLEMNGSDAFTARPAGLCVSTTSSCSSPYSDCAVFAIAGQAFDLTVTPVAWQSDSDANLCDNLDTPNYSASNLGLSSALIAPAGGVNGTVVPAQYNHPSGGASVRSLTQSEVGVFAFNVTPPLYFGAALGSLSSTAPVTFTSNDTGRFVPDHFSVAVTDPGVLAGACPTGNTYSGETMGWAMAPELTLVANNSNGQPALNYTQSGFQKLSANDVYNAFTWPTEDDSAVGSDGNPLALTGTPGTQFYAGDLTPTGNAGELSYVFSASDDVTYLRNSVAEVNPYSPQITFTLRSGVSGVLDSDGVGMNSAVPWQTDGSGVTVRYGRMRLEDTYGPETATLNMPLRTEYFQDGDYLLNTDDDCTVWDSSNATVSAPSQAGSSSGTLAGGSSGSDGILLQAPTSVPGGPDTGDATVSYDAPAWLEYDYDGDGSPDDPEATASFGLNRGHERVIYRKEVR
ncbi:MAG: DUF6701 domain-containing protein [Pseudomonadota bacterium]|nr:DUF6701 domain-containing protein [Pseudomonadota bacterium]